MGNIVCLCLGENQRLHEGRLRIRGRAPDELVFEWCCEDDVENAMAPRPTWDSPDDDGPDDDGPNDDGPNDDDDPERP